MYLLPPFIKQIFLKKYLEWIQSYDNVPLSGQKQNGPFASNENFFRKTIIISMYLLTLSIVQNFKKILRADPKLWARAVLRPKMAHLP